MQRFEKIDIYLAEVAINHYITFTARRGRPKVEKAQAPMIKQREVANDVIMSLFVMKKITLKHFASARFFYSMYGKFLKSIEAPKIRVSSIIQLNPRIGRVISSSTGNLSEEDYRQWLGMQRALKHFHPKAEEILNKVIFESASEDFLNSSGIINAKLDILKGALDQITKYREKNASEEFESKQDLARRRVSS